MKYINVDLLRAVIKEHTLFYAGQANLLDGTNALDGYDEVLAIIDSLQQEQKKVDLRKEIDACWQNWLSPSNQKEVEGVLPKTEFAMYASHFYVLGRQEQPEIFDTVAFQKGVEEGRRLEREDAEHLRDATKKISEDLAQAAKNIYKVPFGTRAEDFIAGAEWQKAKMMEEAVEGYVNYYEDSGGILMAEAQVGCPYHNGDKVSIIVLPKEDAE